MKRINTLLSSFLLLGGICVAADSHDITIIKADSALAILKRENANYVAHPMSAEKPTRDARKESISSQNPIAAIVTCSDSRTSPEIIFDQNLNRLFVVRSAGNVLDNIGLGSIEYAVNNLGVRLVIVMGHQNCGAVKATIAGGNIPPHINSLVNQIKPAVATARTEPGDLLSNSIRANAIRVAEKIGHDAHLGNAAKDVRVLPAYYSFETGEVHWLR